MSHDWFILVVGVACGLGVMFILFFIVWLYIAFKMWHDS